MELLKPDEIDFIAKQCGFSKTLKWTIEELPNKVIGYLGDHLTLYIEVESSGIKSTVNLFVKCMPRFDEWKAQYLRELKFFKKEYVMLSTLFKEFENGEASRKWRPKLLFIKEDIFVFENVSYLGYEMPNHQNTMTYDQLKASVQTLARFHAQSYIYEDRKSNELDRPYRIWDDYSEYLQEPNRSQDFRNTGRNAVIDYLKVFSKYKSKYNFDKNVETILPILFKNVLELMKPSKEFRNAVVHRDLWTNNILLKKETNSYHALFVDYQTVLYCNPMLDLSALIYFNTTKKDRFNWTKKFLNCYYTVLKEELQNKGVDADSIFDRTSLAEAYEKSILFGILQAAIITPIVTMSKEKREQIFYDPESSKRANQVTRSQEFIDIAKEDAEYRTRVTELFDEIIERYVFPKDT